MKSRETLQAELSKRIADTHARQAPIAIASAADRLQEWLWNNRADILAALAPPPSDAGMRAALMRMGGAKDLLESWAEIYAEPCRYDHNGFCQEHASGKPCIAEQTKAWIAIAALDTGH